MRKIRFLPYVLLALGNGAFAAQPPSAGSELLHIPPAPAPEKAPPKIELEQGGTPAIPASKGQKITVKSLKLTGAKEYPEADLIAASGFKPGSELTLAELYAIAAKISDYYHRNGYFAARAYLPAQDIKDGAVTIAVVVGQYGKVTLRNQTNLSDDLANGYLEGLNPGDPIASAPLENRLLLLSDLPGVNVKSTLVPGASVGASDLIVDVTPGQRVTGSIDADNAGNRYTGSKRVGGTVKLNNPTGSGDVAMLRGLTSFDGMNYGRASYQRQFDKVTAGVAYSYLQYSLIEDFDGQRSKGTASIGSVYASYPLIRSRTDNLYAQLAYDEKAFQDKVDATSTTTDKAAHVGMASLYGDHRDNFGGGGLTGYSLTWTIGGIDIQTPAAKATDAATAHSDGVYNKLKASVMRLQSVTETISFYGSINGQAASKNLDVSEKMELGGLYGVRAYPEGEAFGDEGYILNLEVRKLLPKFFDQQPGQLQLIGFFDNGTVIENRNSWITSSNQRTLSGAGVGVSWAETNNFEVKGYYAHRIGDATVKSAPDSSGQFWVQAVKYF